MSKKYGFIILVIVIVVMLLTIGLIFNATYINNYKGTKENIYYDNDWYEVYNINNDADKAAMLLGQVNAFNIDFFRHLKARYLSNNIPTKGPQLQSPNDNNNIVSLDTTLDTTSDTNDYMNLRRIAVENLLNHYNQNKLSENIPTLWDDTTAFVIGKGDDYKLCLRQKDGKSPLKYKSLHDFDTLLFVNLHELSHLCVPEMDHTEFFWNTFKFLLYEAKEMTGRIIMVTGDYCGLTVKYNPLLDERLTVYGVHS